VASAGPYASLHLTPDRQPRQHPTTQFLQAECPSKQQQQQQHDNNNNMKFIQHLGVQSQIQSYRPAFLQQFFM